LVRDEGGNPKGILSVNSDVTVQRSIQAQLMRSQRLESLGTIAGGIAHDLNNVLTPILMGAESLQVQYVDEVSRNIIDIITRSAERGAGIVRQVLSFARGIEGDRKEVQLTHILREIERIILETFPKSIELRCETPKGLWPVSGDATQLHQVLMNLCVNARDAMPNGGRLTLHAENIRLDETFARMNIEAKPIRYVMLKVEDIGSGMPPDVLEKIFDPFFTTKAPGKGTGLGLATTLSIVKSHGGFINVYSEVNKGSSFKVYVPAVEQGAPVSAEELEEIPMGEGELILVVDDEAAVRDITRRILESYGYRVVMAGDGTEALALYVQNKGEIRAMITDMMMPYMDGTSTIRAIRKIDPGARIIATSGLMTNEYAKEAAGLGVQAFLTKPYTAKTFMKTLRDVLSSTP
jgi:nitrogen-specific signal transduction histidine kinase/ActR/RegA family two-component response regulator